MFLAPVTMPCHDFSALSRPVMRVTCHDENPQKPGGRMREAWKTQKIVVAETGEKNG